MTDSEKTNILIVDDVPEKLLVYRSVLDELEQNVVEAGSGSEALKQVLKNDFAVILLDVNMPGMDGFETATLIRQRRRSAHTPIIFLTAFADEVRTSQGYATGAVDYIPTPVVPDILRAKVRVFVELFQMRQQVARQAEEQARRAAAEESARRSAFLSEASRALASSLDLDQTVPALARLGVPQLADIGLVHLAADPNSVECAWADLGCDTIRQATRRSLCSSDWLREVIDRVLTSGAIEFVPATSSSSPIVEAAEHAASEEKIAQIRAQATVGETLQAGSLIVLPLSARGKTLGTLTLARRPSSPSLQRSDLSLAEELAGRAGIALDNAMLVRDIKENDRRKNEFLAMLSHELRNPLAPIRNAIEVLRLSDMDPEELNWAREVIDRQVRHLVRLVDDLLDVSRITRGKIRLQLEEVDVATVVAVAVETSRPLVEDHRHELVTQLPDSPILVSADPARLAQVLSNLLNNAAKYTLDGGKIWLTVAKERNEKEHAVIRIRDTGAGIPRELLTKVFDLFTQVDRSLDRSQGGLGIGLTLVRRLVEMHGGTVQAYSDGPGQGSEFVIRLPVLAEEERPPIGANGVDMGESAPVEGLRVLVVDDNVDAADSLAMLLRLNRHEARVVHDGLAALTAAREFRPDAVLLDIGLPGLDGCEVAERLRADPLTRDALLVAVSGYGREDDRQRSFEAGFNHHLTKPVDFAALQKALASLAGICPKNKPSCALAK